MRNLLRTIRTRRGRLAGIILLASIMLSLFIAVRGRADPMLSVPFPIGMTTPMGMALDSSAHRILIAGISMNHGIVTIFDVAARRVISKVALPNCPTSDLIIDSQLHRAYIPAYDCQSYDPTKPSQRAYLDVLNSDTGRITRALTLPSEARNLTLDTRSNTLFIADDHDGVVALTSTDRIAWRTPLHAVQLLVDESRQRLFVVTERSVVALDAMTGTELEDYVAPLHTPYTSVGLIEDHTTLLYSVQGIDRSGFAVGPTIVYSVDAQYLHMQRHVTMHVHGLPVSIDNRSQRAIAETSLYSSPVIAGSLGDSSSIIDLHSGLLLCHTADYFTVRGVFFAVARHIVINANNRDVELLPESCRSKQSTIRTNMDVLHVVFDSGTEHLYLLGQGSGISSQSASRWPTMISKLLPWLFAPPRQGRLDKGVLCVVDLR